MSDLTVFGPYLGEFGHEIRAWAPHVRYLLSRRRARDAVVICNRGHELLYPTNVRCVPFNLEDPRPGEFMAPASRISDIDNQRIHVLYNKLTAGKRADWYRPKPGGHYAHSLQPRSRFQLAAPVDARKACRVAICIRNRQDVVYRRRNLGRKFWCAAISHAIRELPFTPFFLFFGQLQGNLGVADLKSLRRSRRCQFQDCRGSLDNALQNSIDCLQQSTIAWGESSGPMHLALGPCQRDVVACSVDLSITTHYYKEDNWYNRRAVVVEQKTLTPEEWADTLVRAVRLQCPSQ